MRCLVVTAHPLDDSLCAHLAAQTVGRLRARGHDVWVENLYAQGFSPLLTAAERASYHGVFSPDGLEGHIERLEQAELLVLIFPTWWSGFPAILKGWFDRVWAPGRAFDHAGPSSPLKGRLSRLRHVIAVTTLGAPWWVDRLVMRQPVRRILQLGILGACAPSARLAFLSIHGADALKGSTVERFAARLNKALDRVS